MVVLFKSYVNGLKKEGEISAFQFADECGVSRNDALKFFVSGINRRIFIDVSTKSSGEGDVEILLKDTSLSLL